MSNEQKDFTIVVIAYLISVLAIGIILPINLKWVFVALILISMGAVLQWYWKKHFKE